MGGTPHLRLRVAAELAELAPAQRRVIEFLAPWGPDARTCFALDMVLEEMLGNIVRHGMPDEGEHGIDLEVHVEGRAVIVTLVDDGRAFDPTTAPVTVAATSLEAASTGGRGLVLTRAFARDMQYERVAGCNRLRVSVPLNGG